MKNGKVKRNKKREKLILIFLGVLSLVLVIGGPIIFLYGNYIKSNMDENKSIVFFDRIDSVKENHMDYEVKDMDIGDEEKDLPSANVNINENERLYEEALKLEQKTHITECVDDEEVIFTFAGDILLDDNYAIMSNFRIRGSSIEDTFSQYLIEKMRDSDVFMANNEFTFTNRGTPTDGKTFTFRSKPENVDVLKELGIDVVSLANNHAYDFGEISLLDTMDTLQNAEISYVGAGKDINEAKKPLYIIANGMKIAIVSATQIERFANPDTKEATQNSAGVLRCWDKTALLSVIKEAENNADFTILYIHWGTENQENTDTFQNEQAPEYVAAGVDLIIGNHPHCLQKIEMISGVPVFYSLGNFWFNSKTVNTCLVEAAINCEGLKSLRFIPCIQSDSKTRHLEGEEKKELLNYMRAISHGVTIDDEGYIRFD